MEKSAHWALVAAVLAAGMVVGCGMNTGPSDERVAGDGVLPSRETPKETPPGDPITNGGTGTSPSSPPPGETGPGPTPTPPAPGTKFIFVTKAKVSGSIKVGGTGGYPGYPGGPPQGGEDESMGGREAADLICNEEAKEAKLAGTYLAWLSKDGEDAIARIPESAAGWSLPTGQLVFPNRAHIAAGNGPLTRIIVYATGWWVSSTDVWTATAQNGKTQNPSCNGWESTSGQGGSGAVYYTDPRWTANTTESCNNTRRLICFQK